MEKKNIAQMFARASREEKISPALYNGAIFIQSSGWNTKKYFEKYYDKDGSFPIIITMDNQEGIYHYHFSQAERHAEEIFIKHWNGQNILDQRFENFKKLSDKIYEIYEKLTYFYIGSKKEDEIRDDIMAIKDMAWEINASLFFSIAFDEGLCNKFLEKVQSNIAPDRVRSLWEKATHLISYSLETRRKNMALKLIRKGFPWEELGERCQFFNAHYDYVKNPSEIMLDLREEFGGYTSDQIDNILHRGDINEKKRSREYAKWIGTLSAQERRLVEYIQAIMKLRDARKDPMAQAVAVMYRFAQKVFEQCGIEEKYIFYTHFNEVLKGSQYINSIKNILQKRFPEYSVFVDRDGSMIGEIGIHGAVKEQIGDFYLEQQSFQKSRGDIIEGAIGSPGKARGRVRIIHSYKAQNDLFLKNEILVTGMTRPEFVPLMKKSSAIITDEGGITCHAAIISRELGKPCIIGTKIATKALKDGDLVEVDADRGIVRIIK